MEEFVTYTIYIARWVILAIPGAGLLKVMCKLISKWRHNGKDSTVAAMLISQGILGALVYFVDRWIFSF